MAGNKDNKPGRITTKRYKRNIIIAGVVVILVLAAIIASIAIPKTLEENPKSILSSSNFETIEVQDEEPVDTNNTPEQACNAIKSYYVALGEKNSAMLKAINANYAASALELGWLSNIGYELDVNKLKEPDMKSSFPAPQGIYAGCTLYKIEDFYSAKPDKAIKSDITGETGALGWIYYDSINVRWVIVDPTIPTAISAAEIQNIQRTSADKGVVVKMSSPGAYLSPWWAYTQVSVEVDNKSKDGKVACSTAKFDNGMNARVPGELLGGIEKDSKKSGICQVYRGTLSNFGIEKIGAAALEISGNVCPVVLDYGDENVSPIFVMGDSSLSEISGLLNQAQIEQYNARSEGYDYMTESGTGDSASQQSGESQRN